MEFDLHASVKGTLTVAYGTTASRPTGLTLSASKTLLGEKETKGVIVLRAAADAAPVKELPIAVLGQVSINFVVKVSYAVPFKLTVTPKTGVAAP